MIFQVGTFISTMIGIWNAIQAGISIGSAVWKDGDSALGMVLAQAHIGAWADIIRNDGLNAGQTSMAFMCQAAGGDFLKGMNFESWSPKAYIAACMDATEGASEALSMSIEKASIAVNHAALSTKVGIAEFALNRARS